MNLWTIIHSQKKIILMMGILNYILKIMKLSAAPGKDKKLEIDVIEKNVSSQNT